MITYINKENALDYQILFGKAVDVLKDPNNRPESIGRSLEANGLTWDDFKIGSLNEYFAYLQDILATFNKPNPTQQDLEKQAFFVRLPLDEDVFAIDADKRSISVPSNFSRYGIGVQGDEIAEVLYFTIDRYFDSQDLANNDVQIAIQWEAKDAAKQVITGFSKHFGKDIESEPGKIIFGWPISHELTQTNGTIKFAVRFYIIDNEKREFKYSFTTLPAEVSVNATIDYSDELINKPQNEIDYGKLIVGRIRNSGIYDPSGIIPEEPTITTNLFVMDSDSNVNAKVVDLPTNGSGVQLAIGAKPTTSGILVYDWKQYAYDEASGDYANTSTGLSDEDTITISHPKVKTNISIDDNGQYYRLLSNGAYELITLSSFELSEDNEYVYSEERGGFKMLDAGYVDLYKELSVATIHKVGKYAVDVGARVLANTIYTRMSKADAITIPGPVKPEISFAEGTLVSDNTAHIISDAEHTAVLKVVANKGEDNLPEEERGENPQVDLQYIWKQKVGNAGVSVEGESATPSDIVLEKVPAANINWTGEYGEQNNEKARANQNSVAVAQDGNDIIIYVSGDLEKFISSDPDQAQLGEQGWVAIDIAINPDGESVEGLYWGENYIIGENDIAEANSIGLDPGHIVFWARQEAGSYTIRIGRPIYDEELEDTVINYTELHVAFADMPNEVTYRFNTDKSEMTILGLPDNNLDKTYYVDVVATRNGISTSKASGDYRITNSPEKPVIKIRKYNPNTNSFELVVKDYMSENNTESINRRAGQNVTLSFSVEPPAQSDTLSYIWMRINAQDNLASDWVGQSIKLQADLGDAIDGLAEIIGNPEGDPDFPVEATPIAAARRYITGLGTIGDIASEDYEENGPKYEVSTSENSGYYYCVVINELNGHINANISPFFAVT